MAAAFWPRVEAQAKGDLLNERVAAERAVERILLIMRDEIFPRWFEDAVNDKLDDVRVTVKQKDRITSEVRDMFKLCQLTNADVKIFDSIIDRLAPRLQQVEHTGQVETNHVVMLPATVDKDEWLKQNAAIDGIAERVTT